MYKNILYLINFLRNKGIMKFFLSFFLFGLFYVFTSDTLYKSTITLYPAGELSENTNILSQLSEFTETFGVNVPTKSNYYIPDIIDSYSLKNKIVKKEWDSRKFTNKTNLVDYWEIKDYSFLEKIITYLKLNFNNNFFDKDLYDLNKAIKKLDKLISVNEAYSGLIEVEVLFEEPQLSADIANYISQYVINFVNKEQKIFARKTKKFTEERFKIAENELIHSEDELTNFRKEHPLINDTPELQLLRLRLARNVEVNQEVYITLRNQLEIAKIEESKERLFINILDKAYPSVKKEHPKTFLLLFIFSFLGFLTGSLYYLVLNNARKK
ncbi:MAG: hypothetical protein CMG09_00760 [Candidatus Marinimicrobia bacterium]|nr:hypothetical protein [Candidatus Neomarinimicrobiota bacterium]